MALRLHANSLEDLLNSKSVDELIHFVRIPTDLERKRWLEQLGGKHADQQILVDVARKRARAELGLQEAPVTVSQEMLMNRQRRQQQQQ